MQKLALTVSFATLVAIGLTATGASARGFHGGFHGGHGFIFNQSPSQSYYAYNGWRTHGGWRPAPCHRIWQDGRMIRICD